METLYGENWILIIFLSFIITWGIGLTPPLLIRYVFLRWPMRKPWAILIVVFLWMFNLILFALLGSESKTHGALLLVALVSYGILRKDSGDVEENSVSQGENNQHK